MKKGIGPGKHRGYCIGQGKAKLSLPNDLRLVSVGLGILIRLVKSFGSTLNNFLTLCPPP